MPEPKRNGEILNHVATFKSLIWLGLSLTGVLTGIITIGGSIVAPIILARAGEQTRAIVAEHAQTTHRDGVSQRELVDKLETIKAELRMLSSKVDRLDRP